jgi:hypothetical protein
MQINTKYEIIEIDNKEVTFDVSNLTTSKSLYINATEVAKKFGKIPKDWLRLKETKEYIQALEDENSGKANSPFQNLVQVTKGGKHQGTWLHSDLYIVFVRWLNPIFAVKCDKKIKELLEGNSQPVVSENAIMEILKSNQKTTDAVVEMNKSIQDISKSNRETTQAVMELGKYIVGINHELKDTNHKLANIQNGTRVTQTEAERTNERVEDMMKIVDKLEVYHRRDTLDSEQIKRIQEHIKQKARQIADEENRYYDDICGTLYTRLKSYFQVDKYHEIKATSFAKALNYIDSVSLTREDIGA